MRFWRFPVKCEEGKEMPAFLTQYLSNDNFLGIGQPAGFGLASGFCSGYLFKKVGRAACVTLGVVFVMFQSAAQAGYLTVNWPKIETDFHAAVGDVPKAANGDTAAVAAVAKYFTENTGIASGAFVTGFVLGVKKG